MTMQFGERLKQQREQRGLTQEIVAQEFHVSRATIANWEHERSYPDINCLIAISDYYQISLDVLLKEDSGMTEAMQRKLELQKLKPFYWGSLLIDGFILVILMGRFYQLPFLKTDPFLVMVILLIEVANLYMMLTVRNRQQQLGIQDISQKSIMMYVFGGLIVLLIVGLALLSSQWGAIGVISGGVISGIVMRVRQRRSKNS
ncbi:helix-turn-helix domain-containing protein [Latilactobacillus curvatus]|uniref:helix-turn-helix domain-containing protein n=1 Tax=Latilactobacillus curvatus TaxID=28038 RepID=UPI00200AEAA0|nr:helix-turn-helix transcriptional regulator [Latilactobacillus curvatus]MCP8867298.1 helix-turn-helix domain-containing protein [Latilactobacillus curvatus]MCP8870837.1 helix-turn-helix domain-containing protein [Latilactobacillus curvatus]